MAKKARKGPPAPASTSPNMDAAGIRLVQPDRSAPSGKTLVDFAGEQSLFQRADARQRELNRARGVATTKTSADASSDDEGDEAEEDADATISPRAERLLDTALWCVSLAMLHFTLDVLVQNQYAVAIEWPDVFWRALQALGVFSLLFYNLHRHPSDPSLLPLRGLSDGAQDRLRQALFFAASTVTGCYLIYITNEFSYMAVMMQAPPLGCLWVWSVIEMDLLWAVPSLAIAGGFMKLNDYGL